MNYNEALNFILNKQSLGIKPGLARIKKLLTKMDNPQNKIKIIHVAGTNGKGTIASTIYNVLIDEGYKVGLFSSPWVIDYREQIQINHSFIQEETFSNYIEKYKDNDCTEFEFLTAIMYKYFCDEKVDFAVVECGMGGLGDSTNVEDKNLSVITSVSLDHTDFLGSTVKEIAKEKAGIIKDNSVCVLYPNPDVESVFEHECACKNSKLIKVTSGNNYQENNLNTAAAVLYELGIKKHIALYQLPARHEIINGVLIDGGHNVDAAKALISIPKFLDKIAVIGMMRDKDVEGYVSIVAPFCKKIIVTTPDHSRAMQAGELEKIVRKYCSDIEVIENPVAAVKEYFNHGLDLICGSFYLARQVRNLIL